MTTPEDLVRAGARGRAYADLVRLHAARLPLAVFLVAGAGLPARHLVGGALLILSSYGLAAAGNDLHDIDIDRANQRFRPLATGALGPRDARAAMALCAAVVAASQLLLSQPLGLLVTAAAFVVSGAYSHRSLHLAGRGLWGTAALAVSYLVLPVILAGVRPGALHVAVLIAGGVATLLYKDVKDEVGDRAFGKRTPLVRWGAARMDLVAICLGAATVAGGLAVAGWGWWTVAQVGGLVGQLAMAATRNRRGPLLWAHRLAATSGLVGLSA